MTGGDAYLPVDQATAVRLFEEDSGEWSIDAVDAATGAYTEACWTFDTRAEAEAALDPFRDWFGLAGLPLLTVESG